MTPGCRESSGGLSRLRIPTWPSNPLNSTRGNPEKQDETPASSGSRALEDPEDGVGKERPHRGWRGKTTPARAAKRAILQNELLWSGAPRSCDSSLRQRSGLNTNRWRRPRCHRAVEVEDNE